MYHSYSQAVRLNSICSAKLSHDKRCNELEVWLREWDISSISTIRLHIKIYAEALTI